jgi:sterol desaturase/sphingolipid hydroxylase (fatty acid hydroxylase superfamily)
MLACILVLDFLHDAWFYWTHRLLHWRPLYKYVHWEHHRCELRQII